MAVTKRRTPRREVRKAVAQAELPPKEPGRHRWIATAGYTLTPGQVSAASSGANVTLTPENMFMIGTGCYDCEQLYGNHEPDCPVSDGDVKPERASAILEALPGDVPDAQMAVEAAGQNHLLVKTVGTSAAMMHQVSGGYYPAVLLSLQGRFNRSEVEGTQDAILHVEVASHLVDTLTHTLAFLARQPVPEDDT